MRNTLLNPRALTLAVAAFMIPAAMAATPPSGTATLANDAADPLTYTAGPFYAPNSFGNTIPGECQPDAQFPLVPCDVFYLTTTLPDDYVPPYPGTSLYVRIEWGTPAAEFDLYLWDNDGDTWTAFPSGTPIASSFDSGTTSQQVEVPARAGTHKYVVQVSTTAPNGQSFDGKIWLAPASKELTPVLPPGNASGIAPRFQSYIPTDAAGNPSSSLGLFAAEPTTGYNVKTGSLFYIALLETLRLRFDEATSPAKVTWQAVDSASGASTKATVDPILTSDLVSGRIWAMQLSGGQSATDYSDDDGETWRPTISGGFASGADHQGMGSGPYPAGSAIQHPLFQNAVYYCSQDVATAFCSRSDDGGLTWGPIVPIYDSVVSRCVGLHGHPKVAPDGSVYVPNKGCGLDTPVIGNGKINVVVSEDAGITWTIRPVDDSAGGLLDKGDPSVALGRDNTAYLAYTHLTNEHLHVAVSKDHGRTYAPSVDVGALAGVTHSVFPAAVAGDAGRAAVAFFGTTHTGPEDPRRMAFPGAWYLYVATTYDFGETWFIANATPDNPVQGFGGIGNGGDNRNHYDFIDADIDLQGRILVAHEFGCSASCPNNGGPNTFAKLAGVVRQSGGPRMLAQFDPVEPARPAAPLLNGYRDNLYTYLSWPQTDDSASPITGYNVYRSVDGAPETRIANSTTSRRFVDFTGTGTVAYRVTALNAQGEGPGSNVFAPSVGLNAPNPEASCTLPGQLWADRVGEGAANSGNEIESFSVAEPQDMPGKLVFSIQTASAPSNSLGYVYFDPSGSGLRYRLLYSLAGDDDISTFKDGQIGTGGGTAGTEDLMVWESLGQLEPGSGEQADGSFRLIVDKAKLGIKTGDVLLGVAARVDDSGSPSGVLATDYAGGRQDYLVVGNDYCVNTPPVARLAADTTSGAAPLTVQFSGAASTDADAPDTVAGYSFDFGDGSPETTQNAPTVSHRYDGAGDYSARLRVTDSRGRVSEYTAPLVIHVTGTAQTNRAPTAVLTGPSSGTTGTALSFSGAGSTDPDGDVLTYAYDFGDGATASGVAGSHAYATAGTFMVSLTVRDPDGLQNTAVKSVQISAAPVEGGGGGGDSGGGGSSSIGRTNLGGGLGLTLLLPLALAARRRRR